MRESQPLSVSLDPLSQEPAARGSVAQDPVALWTSRAFIRQAQAWVAAQLPPGGGRLTGRVGPTARPSLVECHPVRND